MSDYQWQKKRDKAIEILRKMPDGSQFFLSTDQGMLSVIHELNMILTARSIVEALHAGMAEISTEDSEIRTEQKKKLLDALNEASKQLLESVGHYDGLTKIITLPHLIKPDGSAADA